MRLVPDQDPDEIARLTEEFLREIAPPGVTIEIIRYNSAHPVLIPGRGRPSGRPSAAAARAFGREPSSSGRADRSPW